MCLQVVVQFAFGLLYAFKAAKSLQVRTPHIGNQSAGRFYIFDQFRDVASVRCSHFYYGNFVFGTQTQQGFRYSHIVVEVAFGMQNIEFLCQHCRY